MAIFCEVTYRPGKKKKDAFWFGHINGKMTEKKKKNQMLFSVGTSMVKYRRPARVLF